MDALRAVAMLPGVVLHALLFLIPGSWPVEDPWGAATSPNVNPYGYLASAIHGFRMPLFFLLSGFFTAMLWQQRGLLRLTTHRLQRIALPLLLGAFTVVPVTAWVFDVAGFRLVHWPLAWLDSFYHLWFLWLLLLLAAAFIAAARLGLQLRRRLWWLVVPLVAVPQLLMHEPIFGPDTSEGPIPDPVALDPAG